ncbi:helix-turn-helix domain-containing protein [Embleya sp. AB8]|uniref:helix-turn-helix domain-containing protein n=1 Tax=Embleya sp. AB8 TaxID=3156304 RepID=UPI003C7928D5
MPPKPKSPSAAQRLFGGQVRFHRKKKGLTQERLAELVNQSPSLIHAIECGRRPALSPLLENLDRELDAGGALVDAAEYLVGEKVAESFVDTADLEKKCVAVDSLELSLVPGMLQTEDYMRALLRAGHPPLDDDDVEARVQGRVERQKLLTRKPTAICSYVIEEWVLHRPIGSRAILKAQLERLLECSAMRNVSIQLMPTQCMEHVGLDGPMLLLEMPDGQVTAHLEFQAGGMQVTDPEQVRVFRQRYGIIRAQALTIADSTALIRKVAGEL